MSGEEVSRSGRVFISYSRKDQTFAMALRERLLDAGLDADLDTEDISLGEPWKERLAELIAGADKMVVVISPDSAESEVVQWEVEEAERREECSAGPRAGDAARRAAKLVKSTALHFDDLAMLERRWLSPRGACRPVPGIHSRARWHPRLSGP